MEDLEKKEINQYFISGLPIHEYGVVMTRVADGTYFTNVPVTVVHHSPTGFAWGYGGSGPADLALNILEYAVRFLGLAKGDSVKTYSGNSSYEAWNYHQSFKRLFIEDVPDNGGIISWNEIRDWLSVSLDALLPIPSLLQRRLVVAYPREYFDDFIKGHPGANTALSKAAFLACVEETALAVDPEIDVVGAPYTMEYYGGSFIINDSNDGVESGELAKIIRDRIFFLFSDPNEWLITKGSINE